MNIRGISLFKLQLISNSFPNTLWLSSWATYQPQANGDVLKLGGYAYVE